MHSSNNGHPSGHVYSSTSPRRAQPGGVRYPLSHDKERIDACYDGEPLRCRTMEDLLGDQLAPGLVPHDLEG
jgi:hypothetical protein